MAVWTLIGLRSVSSVQAGTEAAPVASTDGMLLDAVAALTVWLDAGQGQTITSDLGQADIYVYDNGAWGVAPFLVLQVPPNATGKQRVQLGTIPVENPRGRVAPLLNGVSFSGASAIVEVLASMPNPRGGKAAA